MNASATTQVAGISPSPSVALPVKSGRIAALDFTKGALILIMVLYHWLNYFVGSTQDFYIYLRFLPPSFIFITGFLISHVYLSKYQIADSRLPKRLLTRGVKLFAIFAVLNVLIDLLIRGTANGSTLLASFSTRSLEATYVVGNFAEGRAVAFYVLLPISYLLILSAGLCVVCRLNRYAFYIACVLFLISLLVLELNDIKSGNLEFICTGLLGICIGYIPMSRIDKILKHPFLLISAYLVYLVAINVWGVTYPFQVVSVFLTLMLLYLLGTLSGESSIAPRIIIRLGKYSLYGYIAQIAILQVLRRGLIATPMSLWVLTGSLIVAAMLTIFAVEFLDWARAKSPFVNRIYASVFL